MESYTKWWRIFFAIGIAAIGVQQLIVGDFRPVIVPPSFPAWLPGRLFLMWICSLALIGAGAAVIFELKARSTSLILGGLLLLFVLLFHIPYELNLSPAHLAVWSDPLKCLTLSGGCFIVAGTFPKQNTRSGMIRFLEKLIPAGKYFMAVTMVAFGIDHFLYPDFVATLVPNWIPGHMLWTYVAGVALIAAGVAIIINIKRRLAANLLGTTLFIWLIILHIPRALADPHSGAGNEWTSVFEALAFSGIAFLIARRQNGEAYHETSVLF